MKEKLWKKHLKAANEALKSRVSGPLEARGSSVGRAVLLGVSPSDTVLQVHDCRLVDAQDRECDGWLAVLEERCLFGPALETFQAKGTRPLSVHRWEEVRLSVRKKLPPQLRLDVGGTAVDLSCWLGRRVDRACDVLLDRLANQSDHSGETSSE